MVYNYKQYRRGNLPHIHSPGAILFVTFRLAGSIPQSVLKEWKTEKFWLEQEVERLEEDSAKSKLSTDLNQRARLQEFHRRWFLRFEDVLHQAATGPTWLRDDRVAQLVADSLQYRDGRVYWLNAYSIMSNHVHVVFQPFLNEQTLQEKPGSAPLMYESDEPPLDVIMHSLKSYTAQEANKLLNRHGAFWDAESYDHEVRDQAELQRIVKYVLNNPVKAGLVKDWREWPWNWKRTAGCQPADRLT
jgi:REP-associated tyrosine transposase